MEKINYTQELSKVTLLFIGGAFLIILPFLLFVLFTVCTAIFATVLG